MIRYHLLAIHRITTTVFGTRHTGPICSPVWMYLLSKELRCNRLWLFQMHAIGYTGAAAIRLRLIIDFPLQPCRIVLRSRGISPGAGVSKRLLRLQHLLISVVVDLNANKLFAVSPVQSQ